MADGTIPYLVSRRALRVMYRLGGGLEVRGQENVPPTGPLIVASNHASFLDPTILGAAFNRPLHFMARKTLFDIPIFGWFIRKVQAFPLNREGDSRDAIRTFGELLDQGLAVVMFPEGTRTPDGALGEMKTGVGMLAVRNASPVVPVYIWGSYQSWPRGKKLPGPHRLKVIIGKPLVPSPDKSLRKAEQTRITAEVETALYELERQAWEGEGDAPSAYRLQKTTAGRPDAENGEPE